ncbi:MAG: hypothetical protein JW743_01220, partial [Deltaproteobacteria bacterium]|nr:hypothetical protein [Deltaproteobacteria bacterium]
MRYNSIFKSVLLSFFIIGLIFTASSPVSADCSIVETPTGYSIICSDPISGEVSGTDQNDIIHILPHASLLYYLTDSGDNFTEAMIAGIYGLQGNDEITNEGDIEELGASAETTAVGVSVTIDGIVEGDPLSDSSATANASATGIDGGADNDTIENWADIIADAQAVVDATGVATDITVTINGDASGAALSDASATANAAATGIEGGSGIDEITNWGDIALNANTEATGVAVSLDVAGTMEGNAEGFSVSDSSVTATSTATGIAGGGDTDFIDNRGNIELSANSDATGVAVFLNIAGTMKGDVEGSSLSDTSVTATSAATGIDGGDGNDTIVSDGPAISADVGADATAVSVALVVSGSMEGNVVGEVLSDSSTTANAMATGIDGGMGQDTIDNWSYIYEDVDASATAVGVGLNIAITEEGNASGAALSDASVTANAAATGIDGGGDFDDIDNRGDIELLSNSDATGVAVSLDVAGSMEGNVAGEALSDSSVAADAMAIGIDGGSGIDEITNRGTIVGNADSSATAVGVAVDIGITGDGNASGAALSDASVTADAAAAGIGGGDDGDIIDNRGNIELTANTEATGVAVSLDVAGTMKGDAEGSAVSDASVTAVSTATGIDGGEGDDTIDNDSLITTAYVDADAKAVSVGLTISGSMEGNVAGEALSDGSATADAMATGIDGGMGQDTIDNWSYLYEDVDASATAVTVGVDVAISIEEGGNATGAALSDASVTANAAATGIDGGGDSDDIDNRGDIELLSNSDATGVDVSLTVAGTMKGDAEGSSVSDASVTATSTATGIEGGEGDDTIENEGMITLMNGSGDDETDASATAVSVDLTVSGSMEGNVAGEALSDSSATADAMAIGIDGGSGIDEITNRGEVVGSVDSSATAVGVAVGIDITKDGDATGAALSDASATADAMATGIDGGGDSDDIDNRGNIGLSANSDATGVAVSLDVAGTMKGDAEGSSVSDASVTATSTATGIDGGEGDDTIDNEGLYNLISDAEGDSVAASVTIAGTVVKKGVAGADVDVIAVSNASSTAEATTVGLDGGEGNDTITNMNDLEELKANTESDTVAVSVGVDIVLTTKGASEVDLEGAALSDASATAAAVVAGLDAGDGDDTLVNEGDLLDLQTYAKSESDAVSVDIAGNIVSKGAATGDVKGEAVSDASSTAEAFTVGIDGGEGNDTITNRGDLELLKAEAESDAFSLS